MLLSNNGGGGGKGKYYMQGARKPATHVPNANDNSIFVWNYEYQKKNEGTAGSFL
jgi:hypothetical protein